jgi:YesN/AraC family two-component response regulator
MTSKTKLKIFLVDDHEMFRNGLKSIIEQENIGEIVAEAATAALCGACLGVTSLA